MDTGIPWIAIYTCIHASLEYLLELHAYPLLYIGLFYFFFSYYALGLLPHNGIRSNQAELCIHAMYVCMYRMQSQIAIPQNKYMQT